MPRKFENRHGGPHRARAIYVPSWGRPCGVFAYAASVLENLPRSSRPFPISRAPQNAPLELLQVEHQDLLFNDQELDYELMSHRDLGTRVVITEHSVSETVRSFEASADVLVALTAKGADIIRARWRTIPVVQVHHGCPNWFPPRKRKRGAVIGTFGFLEPHKGFNQLLDVLRALPGTELLIFAHAKSAAAEADWAAQCTGLPVRWERRYLPTTEIARRLAAEADVIIFWHKDRPQVSASGAVRIGLATGVPVLTSRTQWFADLTEVTYQPSHLIEGVARVLADTPLRNSLVECAQDFCHQNTWRRTAAEYSAVWEMAREL
jgi:glycosyltransferase involved in cell wall biosynthesis